MLCFQPCPFEEMKRKAVSGDKRQQKRTEKKRAGYSEKRWWKSAKKKKKKQIRNSGNRSREGGRETCGVEWRGDIWWPEAICGDIFTPLLISNARTMFSGSFVTRLPNKLVTTSATSAAPNVCVCVSIFWCALTVLFPTSHTQNAESFNRRENAQIAKSAFLLFIQYFHVHDRL